MTRTCVKIITCALLALLTVTGCNYTKRLPRGQYLIEKNTIRVHGDKISQSELDAIVKTQPNRKIFGSVRFHLWLYNIPDTAHMAKKTLERHKRIKKKNVRKQEKGKKKQKKLKPSVNEKIGRWLMTRVGEAPMLLDSSKISASVRNLNNYVLKKGYFDNRVTDSVHLDTVRKKAYLFYDIYTNNRYYIDTFIIRTEDKNILKPLAYSSNVSLIKKGDPVNVNVLDDERSRLVTFLKDRGYYDFNRDYITFSMDSVGRTHLVKLTMNIARVTRANERGDSTWREDHKRYNINNIYIFADYTFKDTLARYDSTHYKENIILYNGKPSMKPHNLVQHIYMSKGNYYRAKEVESTYKKLGSLGIYRNSSIRFSPNIKDPKTPFLDCFIILEPLKRQTYGFEANGTNRGGNLGIAGSFSYRNKNLFRGAEALKISLKGGIEAQQLLANENETTVGSVDIGGFNPLNTFNTIEFGPEVSLSIPKMAPFKFPNFTKRASPHTIFTASLNFQQRPDFTRTIQEAKWAWEWTLIPRNKKRPGQIVLNPTTFYGFYFSPFKISAVKIDPSLEFRNRLNTIKDPFLKYSYTDHLLLGHHGIFTLSTQRKNKNKDQFYVRAGVEQSGNILRSIFAATDQPKDSIGSYHLLGIRFAQYLKLDADIRYQQNFNRSSRMIYRVNTGVGMPQANLNEALPFEKSFYVGGSNGLRAFRARTIGPGGFYDTTVTYDKTGEVLLEGNLEYRFDLIKIVKGALFYDVGNIWLLRKNEGKPAGEISANFYKQLAMGAGIGLRFDLDFFLFRLDFAYPIRQPNLPDGEKWFWQSKPITNGWLRDYAERNGIEYRPFKSRLIVNIGIGYPF